MSDAMWDNEYSMAVDIKEEIIEICKNWGLPTLQFSENARTWELEPVLNGLKETEQMLNQIYGKINDMEENNGNYMV